MIQPQIISNPERTVRVDRLHREMARQGITDYKLWPSIHIADKPKRTGISRAHKQIIEWAALEGMEEVCVFEDDIWFPSDDGWKYYLENKPTGKYSLYLGGLSRGDVDESKITKRYSGQFCYFVHESFYDLFLSVDERLDIDGAMAGRGWFNVCYPYACFCYPGWSDNTGNTENLNHLLIGKELYGFGEVKNEQDAKRMTEMQNKHSGLVG